ncbi:hypothetical protein Tco_0959036 [Tanacetum coccineum]
MTRSPTIEAGLANIQSSLDQMSKSIKEDVQGWLYRIHQFLTIDHIEDDSHKIILVSMHMSNKELNWQKRFLKRFRENVAWEMYKRDIMMRIDSVYEDPMVELKNLKQITYVQLKDEIGMAVRMFKPTKLTDVYCLAKMQEQTINVLRNRHAPLLSTPKNQCRIDLDEDGDLLLTEEGVVNTYPNLVDEPPLIFLNAMSGVNTYITMRESTLFWRFVRVVHCASGLSFLTAVCLIRQRFLKIISHSDLGNKPLPISFLGSGLVFLLHSGLPLSSSSGLAVRLRSGLPSVAMGIFQKTLAEGNECALHLGPKQARVYYDLSPEDKKRYNADIRATNILLQGLPKDIYTLINHYTDAKDIWDNVKMLLEGSELTKEDRESQLYDDFEHFRQNKGETIHDYYVRFTKLINDMRNIKMTMPRMQLNSKFVNNMLLEWGRFVTAVKLNRGLKESNYDQLYAYLKQHEAHANENKMMLERFTQHTVDPLALMSNVSPQQYSSQSSTTPPSTHVPPVTYQPHFADNTQLDSGLSPTDNLIENLTNTLALLTQSYKTYLPQTNNQLRTSSNTRNQATVQDGRVVVQNVQGRQNRGQGNNPRGAGAAGNGGAQNRVGNANPGQARQIKCYNCNAQENGVVLDEEQLLFLACGHETAVDEDVDESPVQDLAFNVDNVFQADECDAFDSDVDEAPTAQTMFMANLSSTDPVYDEASPSYDSDILSEDNVEPVVQTSIVSIPAASTTAYCVK